MDLSVAELAHLDSVELELEPMDALMIMNVPITQDLAILELPASIPQEASIAQFVPLDTTEVDMFKKEDATLTALKLA